MDTTKQINNKMINQLALHKQHLLETTKTNDIIQITKDTAGLHAQISITPYISLYARMNNFKKEQLEEQLYSKKNIVRIKAIRRTIYIFTKEMVPTAYMATKRLIETPTEKYLAYLGIDSGEYKKTAEEILKITRNAGLSTKEIKDKLETNIKISPIISIMCDQGLLARRMSKGGWRSNLHTYQEFKTCYPDINLQEVTEEIAKEKMIEQYIKAFGAVTEKDIAWWTGFPLGEIRNILKKLEEKLIRISVTDLDEKYLMLKEDIELLESMRELDTKNINLLPILDPYMMGYKDRNRYLDIKYYDYVYDFGGNATSTILLDGRVIGIWDLERYKEPLMKIYLFEKIDKEILEEIYNKAKDLGRFLTDEDVDIRECKSMISLKQRTAGGFQAPLRDCYI